ncbi:hypothetical protein KA050_03525 [Candidatus Gracilibacteria bacterium]|nr:hypothetical protein [Candidatus Gracilibacteria bacterium]
MKKILATFSVFFLTAVYAAGDLQTTLVDGPKEVIPTVKVDTSNINYVSIAQEIKFWLFAFIGIIAVAYIIYIGAKLLWAPGSTEEITTSLKSLLYVVVGLALIPFALFIVQFIVNIRI